MRHERRFACTTLIVYAKRASCLTPLMPHAASCHRHEAAGRHRPQPIDVFGASNRQRYRRSNRVEQESSFMETNVLRGEFLEDEKTRHEFMSIVKDRKSTRLNSSHIPLSRMA